MQENLGNNQDWKDHIKTDEPYTQQAILHSEIAGHPYYDGVYPVINPSNSHGFDEGVVIDWWDPNAKSPIDGPGMGLAWNEIPYPGNPAISLHDHGLLTNENMSAEKARANIDTIMNYFAPRACITLQLSDCVSDIFTSSTSTIGSNTKIKLFPNPAIDRLTIDAGNEEIESVQFFNNNGQLLKTISLSKVRNKEIDLNNLPDGFYLAKVKIRNEYIFKNFIIAR